MAEEYFDILDKNGNKIGKKKLRSEVHRDGDWHKAVFIVIINLKGDILMQKRGPNKDSQPNKWDLSVGGHIAAGCDGLETAIREAEEELGIQIDQSELKYILTTKSQTIQNNGNFINNTFYDFYLLQKDLLINNLKLEKEAISEVKYFNLNDLQKLIESENTDFVLHETSYPKLFKLLKEKYAR